MLSLDDGIGVLSGRAIYAVREFALRGVDRIAIRRQLSLNYSGMFSAFISLITVGFDMSTQIAMLF